MDPLSGECESDERRLASLRAEPASFALELLSSDPPPEQADRAYRGLNEKAPRSDCIFASAAM